MKKLISLLCTAAVIISVLSVFTYVCAAGSLDIEVTSKQIGDKLYVSVDITNNPGVWSVKTAVDYNSDALRPASYTAGTVFSPDQLDHSALTDEDLLMIAYGDSLKENVLGTGNVISYEFDIINSTLPYGITVSANENDVFDCNLNKVAFTVKNDANTPTAAYVKGDVNLDGTVNVIDIFYMKSIIAGSVNCTSENILTGDLSGDGGISVTDIYRLKTVLVS